MSPLRKIKDSSKPWWVTILLTAGLLLTVEVVLAHADEKDYGLAEDTERWRLPIPDSTTFIMLKLTLANNFIPQAFYPPRIPVAGECLVWEVNHAERETYYVTVQSHLRIVPCPPATLTSK